MATNLDRAQVVSKHVQIESVSLTHANVSTAVDPFAIPDELGLEQSYRARYETSSDRADILVVFVELRLSANESAGDEHTAVLDLEATYRLVYRLKDAAKYPSDALQHFAELNGPYNIWPYWRELVQTVSGRAGVASIVIPVFKPPIRKLTAEEEEQLELAAPTAE